MSEAVLPQSCLLVSFSASPNQEMFVFYTTQSQAQISTVSNLIIKCIRAVSFVRNVGLSTAEGEMKSREEKRGLF